MSAIETALAEIVAAYKADPAFVDVSFPGDPGFGSNVEFYEQFNEWPVLLAFPITWPVRFGSADDGSGLPSDWTVYQVRIEVHDARTDQSEVIPRLISLIRPVSRVFMATWRASRFGGAVNALGDPETRGPAPLRCRLAPDNWGGIATVAIVCEADLAIEERSNE